ncbi:mitochondrial chaperone Frataxin [Bimuria novae-zelandiae CBS 107.79]|uniref:ferroxidase n=1 Tax=Bimuria novae-zelandiae CBS 107.79 TaxID=1447943 RepID=A0A6A5VQI4_9PLEO|nr:mitochondrial chaperone Frataxin [Bimuria novae-zelandiae CBS 107.79]
MKSLSRAGQVALRRAARAPLRVQLPTNGVMARAPVAAIRNGGAFNSARDFHSSMTLLAGIMPESENPPAPQVEKSDTPKEPTAITTTEYHKHADGYFDELVARLEEKQEESPDYDVEYSAGVLHVKILSSNHEYVLNKQPPNKQIWWSSPISGPKRFDWVVLGESMHEKEGGGAGDWIYLRDGSSLTDLVRKELGVELGTDAGAPS